MIGQESNQPSRTRPAATEAADRVPILSRHCQREIEPDRAGRQRICINYGLDLHAVRRSYRRDPHPGARWTGASTSDSVYRGTTALDGTISADCAPRAQELKRNADMGWCREWLNGPSGRWPRLKWSLLQHTHRKNPGARITKLTRNQSS